MPCNCLGYSPTPSLSRRGEIPHKDGPSLPTLGVELSIRARSPRPLASPLIGVRLRCRILPGKDHRAADNLSRLPPPPPLVPELPLDTEIPCFTVEDESEPGLLQMEDSIEAQQADQRCLDARDGLITATGVDYDYQVVLGQVLPSGEFRGDVPFLVSYGGKCYTVCGTSIPLFIGSRGRSPLKEGGPLFCSLFCSIYGADSLR
jgi:hypothetical protein